MGRRELARRAASCMLGLAGVAAGPVHAQSVTVAQGPMIGAVTTGSAAAWVRLTGDASVRVRWIGPGDASYHYSAPVAATAAADETASLPMPGLGAGTPYTYQVGITGPEGVEVWGGTYAFTTVAAPVGQVSFAVLSDFSNKLKSSPALRSALAARPDFLAVIGDLDHRNPAAGSKKVYPLADWPQVLADLRAMHRDTRDFGTPIGSDFATGLIGRPDTGQRQIPLYYGWDDHDFCMNNADDTCRFAPQAVQAAREYYLYPSDNGIDGRNGCPIASTNQRIDYAPLLSVFILDARSARDWPSASMLGPCQYEWLTQGLASSQSTWKVVLTPVPFNPTIKTWDGWGAFPAERAKLASFIQQSGIRNLVFLSGDVHSGGALDDGTHSGWPELSVPHANMPDSWINTYCETFNQGTAARSEPGLWTIGTLTEPDFDATLTPTCRGLALPAGTRLVYPPAGVYATSGKGSPGYVQVDVTATTLRASVMTMSAAVRTGQRADGSTAPMTLNLTAQ